MSETQIVISKGSSEDISRLAAGANRVDVALGALKEQGDFSPEQIVALQALAQRFEGVASNDKAPSLAQPVHQEFQLKVFDKTKTEGGVATGTIEVAYVIPAFIDHATARAKVIQSCKALGRGCPAIRNADLAWYPIQRSERHHDTKFEKERVVQYTIDFDSKDSGYGTMNMAGHRAYARERGAHITPSEQQTLGAALFYAKTGKDLMKGYQTRAVVSSDESVPGVALRFYPEYGVFVHRDVDGTAHDRFVAAFSPN